MNSAMCSVTLVRNTMVVRTTREPTLPSHQYRAEASSRELTEFASTRDAIKFVRNGHVRRGSLMMFKCLEPS